MATKFGYPLSLRLSAHGTPQAPRTCHTSDLGPVARPAAAPRARRERALEEEAKRPGPPPLQSYTEAVWLSASRSKGFAKTSVSVRSRNVATSRATAGGERLATCSGCSCRSSSIVSIGLSRVAGSQSARVARGA